MSKASLATVSKKCLGLKQLPMPNLWDNFTEAGPRRIQHMDAGKVSVQVISHGPCDLTPDQSRAANNEVVEAIRTYPTRFAGFAVLPIGQPEEAAAELQRTCSGAAGVKFVGALIENHTGAGEYYEGPEYDVLWKQASDLDVPIYLHPSFPSDAAYEALYKSSTVPDWVTTDISDWAYGWHSNVATHLLKLFAAGVFDRFPKLKIIIGHFGEMIPFMLQRIVRISGRWGNARNFQQVWDENIWLTTSGNWSLDPLATVLRNTKKDRILYSVDYPFGSNEQGLEWLEELEASGLVSKEELEGIRWKNASKLLRLDVKA
ncbi:hypothetical protein VPNG_01337 [Cytospora leucostoma]|uniref:Amidohydrolase-related domain-containing protein n=1 Tax=Cytospora leucostoma TaxID=1230097 RepID=A0A423XL26_9PEZI|nr:hypothetical protein VPNG_01337 [Cytospora leucostoma]